LHYNLARYYDPAISRWAAADSVTTHVYDPQSLNRYAYNRNDPVNLVDPDGRDFFGAIWSAITNWWYGSEETSFYYIYYNYDQFAFFQNSLNAFYLVGPTPPAEPSYSGGGAGPQVNEALLQGPAYLAMISLRDRPECAAMFGTKDGLTAIDVLNSIVNGGQYGGIRFAPLPLDRAAQTMPNGDPDPNGIFNSVTITINTLTDSSSVYWNSTNGSDFSRQEFLLHELGHALFFLGFRGGTLIQNDESNDAQEANRTAIWSNCIS
jgi:hypothetical protein